MCDRMQDQAEEKLAVSEERICRDNIARLRSQLSNGKAPYPELLGDLLALEEQRLSRLTIASLALERT